MNLSTTYYHLIIRRHMLEVFNFSNSQEIGKLLSVTLSGGINKSSKMLLQLYSIAYGVELMSFKLPIFHKSKSSVASFSIKEGSVTGWSVTFRNKKCSNFLYRYCNFILPRISDFKGFLINDICFISELKFGHVSSLMFPELDIQYELFKNSSGFNFQAKTSCVSKLETIFLFRHFQFPLQNA